MFRRYSNFSPGSCRLGDARSVYWRDIVKRRPEPGLVLLGLVLHMLIW